MDIPVEGICLQPDVIDWESNDRGGKLEYPEKNPWESDSDRLKLSPRTTSRQRVEPGLQRWKEQSITAKSPWLPEGFLGYPIPIKYHTTSFSLILRKCKWQPWFLWTVTNIPKMIQRLLYPLRFGDLAKSFWPESKDEHCSNTVGASWYSHLASLLTIIRFGAVWELECSPALWLKSLSLHKALLFVRSHTEYVDDCSLLICLLKLWDGAKLFGVIVTWLVHGIINGLTAGKEHPEDCLEFDVWHPVRSLFPPEQVVLNSVRLIHEDCREEWFCKVPTVEYLGKGNFCRTVFSFKLGFIIEGTGAVFEGLSLNFCNEIIRERPLLRCLVRAFEKRAKKIITQNTIAISPLQFFNITSVFPFAIPSPYRIWGAERAHWLEQCSPPINVTRVQLPDSASYVSWVCWFSTLHWEAVPAGTPVFPSPQKPTFDLHWFVGFSLQCPQLVLQC